MSTDSYIEHVVQIEDELQLAPYAKRSFEGDSSVFVDGEKTAEYFERKWSSEDTALKLRNRTPLQIERDRILYSSLLRKQTDKYHVLFSGSRRIVRNYTTHTMRMTQVVRSVCRPLRLNSDFAEALALGSKSGATPFIHSAKNAASDWLINKLEALDKQHRKPDSPKKSAREALQLDLFQNSGTAGEIAFPSWVEHLQSDYVINSVKKYIPWARGESVDRAYSSGQESYWLLTVNPFTREARDSKFFPETMYGVWRHGIENRPRPNSFHHRVEVEKSHSGYHELRWDHATYEGAVVQYADDITWTIENLNDANLVALMSGQRNLYNQFLKTLDQDSIPGPLLRALSAADSGQLYTYFVESFIENAQRTLRNLGPEGTQKRLALREGKESSFLTLSEEVEIHLEDIKKFLTQHVFLERRLMHRNRMLDNIVAACLDILYEGVDDILPRVVEEKGKVEEWSEDDLQKALSMLQDDVHRAQLAVDIFADMGDQEIYDFVGIQSL